MTPKTTEQWLNAAHDEITEDARLMGDAVKMTDSVMQTMIMLWLAKKCAALDDIIAGLKVARDGSRQQEDLYARYHEVVRCDKISTE